MSSKINKKPSDEIDISELIITTWNSKWKVFFIILITVTVSIYNNKDNWEPKNNKIIYQGKTKIIPISIFSANNYKTYNNYLTSIEEKNLGIYNLDISNKKDFENILVVNKDIFKYNLFKGSSLSIVDRMFLYELFLEKLNSNDLYIKGIKEFNLLKKEDFQNTQEYENAVLKLSSLIKKPNLDFNERGTAKKMASFIEFRTSDDNILVWEKILYFVQNSANNEINDYLKKNFEILISNENRLRQYKIEDIEFEIKNSQNEKIKNDLIKVKKKIQQNKDIERLINIFENTPIMMSDDFKAALIKIPSTEYSVLEKTTYTSPFKIVFFSAFLGLFLGIIFVLISKVIQKKST